MIRKYLNTSIQLSSLLILFLLVLGYFIDFGERIDTLIRVVMFSLIGLLYLVFSWGHEKKGIRFILFSCGAYLILMNFLPDFELKSIFGIITIVTPMLLSRYLRTQEDAASND